MTIKEKIRLWLLAFLKIDMTPPVVVPHICAPIHDDETINALVKELACVREEYRQLELEHHDCVKYGEQTVTEIIKQRNDLLQHQHHKK